MDPLALLNHAVNFLAPALWLALLLPMLLKIFIKKRPLSPGFIAQAAWLFIVGSFVLGFGLVLFGRDGKMPTYVALVLLCATAQWIMLKGWRA